MDYQLSALHPASNLTMSHAKSPRHKNPPNLQEVPNMQPTKQTAYKNRSTKSQTGILSKLPLELLYTITDHLRLREITCLSLTCRELYQNEYLRHIWTSGLCQLPHCSGRLIEFWDVESDEMLGVLKLIWMDLPNHSLCGKCFSFYAKDKPSSGWFHCGACTRTTRRSEGLQVIPGEILPWWCIRAAMDCHAQGATQDKNLACIRLRTDWLTFHDTNETQPATWRIRSSIEAEIVEGKLMTHACQRLLYAPKYTIYLGEQSRVNHFVARRAVYTLPTCEHSRRVLASTHPCMLKIKMCQIPGLITNDPWNEPSKLRRCGSCMTEYKWMVHEHSSGALEIILDTWRFMVEVSWPAGPINQRSVRWSYKSSASNIDNLELVPSMPRLAQKPSKHTSRVSNESEVYKSGSELPKISRARRFWTWLKKVTSKAE